MPTPAPSYNFASIPDGHKQEPLWDNPKLPDDVATGKLWLAEPAAGRRLTLSTDMMGGRPESVIVLPQSSWWPLWSAVATGGFFVGVLLKMYMAALVALAVSLILFLCWAWAGGSRMDVGPIKAREDVGLLLHFEHPDGAPGWHGTVYTLVADAAVLASLVFGVAYLWALAPAWPPPVTVTVPIWAVVGIGAGWLVAAFGGRRARQRLVLSAGEEDRPWAWLALHGVALAAVLLVLGQLLAAMPPASTHAQSALTAVLLWYASVHIGAALVLSLFLMLRWKAGFVSARRSLEARVVWLFSHYSLGSALVCVGLAAALARST